MRVSTQGAYLSGLRAMQRLQEALDATQRQISSGRRIQNPSDDPIAASRALEFRETVARLEQFDRNSTVAENRLSQEEAALNSVNNVLQRVRELALQANNATQSAESRRLIAVEMREQLSNLVQLANQRDGTGRYLFAGNIENAQPVARAGSAYTYNGDQGQRLIQIGEGRQVADGDPGANVFFRIRNGNGVFSTTAATANGGTGVVGTSTVTDPTQYDRGQYTISFLTPDSYEVRDGGGAAVATGTYTPGDTIAFRGIEIAMSGQPDAGDAFAVAPSGYQDVFTTIDALATAIEQTVTDDAAGAKLNNEVNTGLLNIDQALGNVLDIRTQVGSRLAAIEGQRDNNSAFALAMQTALADIEDLDYAEAISRLTAETTTLEAAQKSFVLTRQLSLFNYF
jgi:flagellar hook-associated protein 3 FlgL